MSSVSQIIHVRQHWQSGDKRLIRQVKEVFYQMEARKMAYSIIKHVQGEVEVFWKYIEVQIRKVA